MKWIFVALAVVVVSWSASADAQFRTTASRVRDLEHRFNEFLLLQDELLQTVTQIDRRLLTAEDGLHGMESRLQGIEQQLGAAGRSTEQWTEARSDFQELRQRLSRLEAWTKNAQGSTPSEHGLAWAVAEQDILSARTSGLQGRVHHLASRSARHTAGATPLVISLPDDIGVRLQQAEPVGVIRLIIEVRVTTDSRGRVTSYQVVQ